MFDKFNKKEMGILNYFLENPNKELHLREIAKKLEISSSTAKIGLDNLLKKELIKERKIANLRIFRCNLDNSIVRELKIVKNLDWLRKTKVVERIKKTMKPVSIVLFGSFAKGINDSKSDLDILVITDKKENFREHFVEKYELQLICRKPLEWNKLGKKEDPFYYEVVVNGIPLYGMMPL